MSDSQQSKKSIPEQGVSSSAKNQTTIKSH